MSEPKIDNRYALFWSVIVVAILSSCKVYPTGRVNGKIYVDFPEQDSLRQFFLDEINANIKAGRYPSRLITAFCDSCDYHFRTMGVKVVGIDYTRKKKQRLLRRPDGVVKIGDKYYPVKYENLSSFVKSRNLSELNDYESPSDTHRADSLNRFIFVGIGDEYFFTSWDPNSLRGTNSACPEVEIFSFPTRGFTEKELDSIKITPFTRGSNFTKTLFSYTTSYHRYNETDSTRHVLNSLTSTFDYEILIANKYKYKLSEIATKKISRNGRSICKWSELKLNGKLIQFEKFIISKP